MKSSSFHDETVKRTDLESLAEPLDGVLQLMVLRLTDVDVELWYLCWSSCSKKTDETCRTDTKPYFLL